MNFLGLPLTNLLTEEDALSAIEAGFVTVPQVPFFVNEHLPFDVIIKPPGGGSGSLRLIAPSYAEGMDIVAPERITIFKPGVYVRDWAIIDLLIEKLNSRNKT